MNNRTKMCNRTALSRGGFTMPENETRISTVYGVKNPALWKFKGYHTGIDFVAMGPDKSIYAVRDMTILRARFAGGSGGADPEGWGNYIIGRQSDGYDVLYAHLAQVAVVQGQKVVAGAVIGLQGATGNTKGAHLHFEVWGNWEKRDEINPADYLGISNIEGPVKDMFDEDRIWAMSKGITDGTNPDGLVPRKQLWAMLRRALKEVI